MPILQASFDIGWRAKFAMGQRRYCAALRGAIDSDLPPPSAIKRPDLGQYQIFQEVWRGL